MTSFRPARPKPLRNLSMPINSSKKNVSIERAPVEKRRGITISERTKRAFAEHDHSKDDPDSPVLPPEKWANAMRRDEFFRPVKKLTSLRIDADVLGWLRSKGPGYLRRANHILRNVMIAELNATESSPKYVSGAGESRNRFSRWLPRPSSLSRTGTSGCRHTGCFH